MIKYKVVILSILTTALITLSVFASLPTKAQATTPRQQTLIIAYSGTTPTLNWNPLATGAIGIEDNARHLLFLPYSALNGYNLRWTFILTKSLELRGDEIVGRIRLWDEARWSDGTPLTVDDIIGSFNLSRTIGGGWWGDWFLYNYAKVDEKTVDYYIGRRPGQDLPKREDIRSVVQGGIMYGRPIPYHVLKPLVDSMGDAIKTQWRNDDPKKQVVSGPYKLYYYDSVQIVYERIDDWWGKNIFGLPAPKYITFVYFRDAQQAVMALINGEVDFYSGYIPNPADIIRAGLGTWYKDTPYFLQGGASWLHFNFARPYFQDIAVRRAIAWTMPWNQIIQYALLGLSVQPSMTGLADMYPHLKDFVNKDACRTYWGTETCRPQQNITKAIEILNAAGIVDNDGDGIRELPDGTSLKFTISVPAAWTTHVVAAQLIANALKQIGMSVIVDTLDYRVWDQNIRRGEFDATIGWGVGGAIGTATPFTDLYGNMFEYANYKQWALWSSYTDDEVTSFINEMNSNYLFPERLKRVVWTFQERIVFEKLPAVPVFHNPVWYAYNTKYWEGFPNAESPPEEQFVMSWWGATPWYFLIRPKGQQRATPWFLKHVSEGGASIHGWYDLFASQAKCIYDAEFIKWEAKPPVATTTPTPSPTPTPTTVISEVVTTTVKVISTVTITSTSIVTQPASISTVVETVTQTDWSLTIVLAVVMLVVGLAVGYLVKRK